MLAACSHNEMMNECSVHVRVYWYIFLFLCPGLSHGKVVIMDVSICCFSCHFECVFGPVDVHLITTGYANPAEELHQRVQSPSDWASHHFILQLTGQLKAIFSCFLLMAVN